MSNYYNHLFLEKRFDYIVSVIKCIRLFAKRKKVMRYDKGYQAKHQKKNLVLGL